MFKNELKENILSKYKSVSKEFGIDYGIMIRDFARHYHLLEVIREYTTDMKSPKLLDVAAGFAIPSRILKEQGYNIHTTDSYIIAGEKTCKITEKIFPFTRIENLETDPLPFEEHSFDIVLFLATIEHLHNSPRKILQWIYEILKKDGIVIIDTPNILELRKRIMFLLGKSFAPPIKFIYEAEYNSNHHREYTLSDLEYVMKAANFQIIRSEIIDTISPVTISKRTKLKERTIGFSALEQMTRFKVGWDFLSPYTYLKLPYSLLVKLVPSFRDTLFVVGKK